MSLYKILRPLFYQFPAETAHELATGAMSAVQNTFIQTLIKNYYLTRSERLEVELWGQTFPNPVGLAAGFDKAGKLPSITRAFGFGFTEIGGVTAHAQVGNPRPRLFRLVEDEALINRMGFNNPGADEVAERLETLELPDAPVGINIGKSKDVALENAVDDYSYTFGEVNEYGDFFVVNVSSPNTPGLRNLQDREPLENILTALKGLGAFPLLVKVSPDLGKPALEEVIQVADSIQLDGIVATNTTTSRPETLESDRKTEEGGLSGRPLTSTSTEIISFISERTDLPIVGVGGIFDGEDAYEKIKRGASLVQLYTGFVYEGPGIAKSINKSLLQLMDQDNYESITEVIGVEST